MKLEIKPTERGFLRADFIDRNKQECSIQESSIATESCLWLGVDTGKHLIGNSADEWTKEQLEEMNVNCLSRMHLTQEIAGELAKQLAYFAEHGRLKNKEDLIPYAIGYFRDKDNRRYYLGILYVNLADAHEKKIKQLATKEFIKIMIDKDLKEYDLSYTCLTDDAIVTFSESQKWKQIREWLSEGQQGFYTSNGLVKEL